MLVFGGIQIVMSQIPDFHNMAWLSVVAALMSFAYSSIGLGLSFAQVIGMNILLCYRRIYLHFSHIFYGCIDYQKYSSLKATLNTSKSF